VAWPAVGAAIVALVDGLPAAARRGEETLTMHARRLTTALQVRSLVQCCSVHLLKAGVLLELSVTECTCMHRQLLDQGGCNVSIHNTCSPPWEGDICDCSITC